MELGCELFVLDREGFGGDGSNVELGCELFVLDREGFGGDGSNVELGCELFVLDREGFGGDGSNVELGCELFVLDREGFGGDGSNVELGCELFVLDREGFGGDGSRGWALLPPPPPPSPSLSRVQTTPPRERKTRGSITACRRDFFGSGQTSDLKIGTRVAACHAPGVTGSVLGLVGPVSEYCDWVRLKV